MLGVLPMPSLLGRMPSAPAASVSFIATAGTTTTDENATTFASANIGTPHPRRLVIVACYHGVAAACTVTIDGQPTARVQNTAHEFSLHYAVVRCGTTASITVTATASLRKAVMVYTAYPSNHQPLDSGTASATTTTNATVSDLKIQQFGFMVYMAGQHAVGTGAFTTTCATPTETVTEDVDTTLESAGSYTCGRITTPSVSSDLADITLAETVSGTKRLCCATWGPPVPYAGVAF